MSGPPSAGDEPLGPSPESLSPRVLLGQLGLALVGLLAIVAVLGLTMREPLDAFSAWFVEELGLVGIFVGVLVLDAIPMTMHEPLLLFGLSGGLGYGPVFLTASTASVLSGFLGYAAGAVFGRVPAVQRWLVRSGLAGLLRRYGVAAVAIGALTPFPYAVSTWGAGAAGVPLKHLFIGALFRFPKVFFYLTLIHLGWAATA